jgi:glycosyltransferase involved in cell wall biosynthesis
VALPCGLLPPVRVTFLTHYYPPEVGAPQARIGALAAGLARGGDEVTVHTGFPNYPDGRIKPPYRNRPRTEETLDGVRVVRSAVFASPNTGFSGRLANHLSFSASALATAPTTGAAEVLVVESPPLFLAGAAIPYARLKRAGLVVNVADLWPDSAIELGALSSPGAIRAARALERAAYRASAAIACPTEGIAAVLAGRPESAGKEELLRPAVDLERFDPSPRPRGDGPLRVLYAGTVGMAHGLETLLDAAAELEADGRGTAVEVTIAGDGAEAPALRDRLTATGPANVTMLGTRPREEVPGLYAEADVAVVLLRDRPIFEDALPTKLLEAMAAGRPLVLSAAGEAARLLEREGAGLVGRPEGPSERAAARRRLAADPEQRERLGAAGRAAAEREFGRGPWLERWRRVLERAARR